VEPIGVRRNKNGTYVEFRFISPEQKAKQQMLASIEMSGAPKGQRSVRDILNIMHDMPSTLKDIGISARTAEAARAAKLAAWEVMLQDWRDVGPHTTMWAADRDEHAYPCVAPPFGYLGLGHRDNCTQVLIQVHRPQLRESKLTHDDT
jgi:hypothetical protein